jgi:membrane protease subunit HflK
MASSTGDGIILANQGPWGSRGGGSNDGGNGGGNGGGDKPNPWGQRGGGGGGGNKGGRDNEPDLDEMLRQAQEKFKGTFGGKKPAGDLDPSKAIGFIIAILAVLWLATGFYTVQPQEDAVVLTFGKVTKTVTNPGLNYRLPWPVQDVQKVNVEEIQKLDIGAPNRDASEGAMLTGDENIVNIHFSVFWRRSDAQKYLFSVQAPEDTVQKVAESAMREVIGRTPIQRALTEGRAEIESKSKELMQKMLDDYKSGIIVNSVQLLSSDPPQPVIQAFNDVQNARTDKERAKNEAETYLNDIVPSARGSARKTIQDAEAYKEAVIAKAQGDAERFLSVYKAYSTSKDVTQKRLYLETMQDILKNSKKIIVGEGGGQNVLPWLDVGKTGGRIPPQPQQ